MKLNKQIEFLRDAEASFASGGTNIGGLFQYGEALFNLGQFENALMAYHRGCRTRKDKEEFRIGINKAQDAILVISLLIYF